MWTRVEDLDSDRPGLGEALDRAGIEAAPVQSVVDIGLGERRAPSWPRNPRASSVCGVLFVISMQNVTPPAAAALVSRTEIFLVGMAWFTEVAMHMPDAREHIEPLRVDAPLACLLKRASDRSDAPVENGDIGFVGAGGTPEGSILDHEVERPGHCLVIPVQGRGRIGTKANWASLRP